MDRPIKFRGVEFFTHKFVYGQTIRQTEDGQEIQTGDGWVRCTELAQLVGIDRDGKEFYENDLMMVGGAFIRAKLFPVPNGETKLVEARTWNT